MKKKTVALLLALTLVLGVVAYTKMTPDLLPNMDFPYVVIVTTDPGASPEAVESDITKPMEQAMATLNEIKHISSTSQNSVSMVVLEFENGANMDSLGIDIQQQISALEGQWSDTVSSPYILKVNPSMIPVMVAAISSDTMDVGELSDFVDEELTAKLTGITGVASVDISGTIDREMHVVLDAEKMAALTETVRQNAGKLLDKEAGKLSSARKQVTDAQAALDAGIKQAADGIGDGVTDALNQAVEALKSALDFTPNMSEEEKQLRQTIAADQEAMNANNEKIQSNLGIIADPDATEEEKAAAMAENEALTAANLELARRLTENTQTLTRLVAQRTEEQLRQGMEDLRKTIRDIEAFLNDPHRFDALGNQISSGAESLIDGMLLMTESNVQLKLALQQIEEGEKQLAQIRRQVLEQLDLNGMLSVSMIEQLLTAQDFSMPAGYIDDNDGISYMVSVGNEITTTQELEDMVLFDLGIDGMEPIRLSDVATVFYTDNSDEIYAKLDGNNGIIASFSKQSNYATAEVSDNIVARLDELTTEYEGIHFKPLMDQGDYIHLIVETIVSSLLWGALFSVVVLYLFLRDWRPTVITLVSIPISVIFAVVLMYFTGVTINMISLSGLAVSVGMLVDNSVVVIENIYRLRGRGVPAPRASVQGARQVSGSIISSTLTTICVFLPMIFSTGMVRELLTDMALTITFSLLASLIVALTVVPCAGSTVLRTQKEVKHLLFDKLLDGYEKALRFCLKVKALPLGLAIGLLVLSVWRIATMGIVMIPDMGSNQLSITVDVADDTAKDDAFATADAVMDAVSALDGVQTVGAMSGGNSMVSMMGSDAAVDNTAFTYYVLLTDEGARRGSEIQEQITDATASLPCEVTVNANGMMDMSALSGNGIEVDLYGSDLNDLNTAAEQVVDLLNSVDGIANASDGQENGDEEINISIDKDKAMRMGLTVAQVYQQVAAKLTTDTTATTLKANGTNYTVTIVDKTETPDLDSLFNMEFETTTTDEDGSNVTETHTLGEFATRTTSAGFVSIARENGSRKMSVTSETVDGYNTTLLSREVEPKLAALDLPDSVTAELAGETTQVTEMLSQMAKSSCISSPTA